MAEMSSQHYHLGDACICWSFGKDISRELSYRVHRLYRLLIQDEAFGNQQVLDLVPSYNALAIHFDPARLDPGALVDVVDGIIENRLIPTDRESEEPGLEGKQVVIPVVYDGEDLERVAELNGLSVEEVIDIHVSGDYTVAMIGFLPHFPYLIGLDKRLVTPRLDSPRTTIPAGSVSIAAAQAGIYPRQSPGGWNIVGSMDPELLKPIEPGDKIIFKRVEKL